MCLDQYVAASCLPSGELDDYYGLSNHLDNNLSSGYAVARFLMDCPNLGLRYRRKIVFVNYAVGLRPDGSCEHNVLFASSRQ